MMYFAHSNEMGRPNKTTRRDEIRQQQMSERFSVGKREVCIYRDCDKVRSDRERELHTQMET
jgi:hypothetical protein